MKTSKDNTEHNTGNDLEKIFELSARVSDFDGIDTNRAWERVSTQICRTGRPKNNLVFLRIAAAVLILLSLGILVHFATQTRPAVMANNSDTLKSILLSDGTAVLLYPGASLTWVENEFGQDTRKVELTGKALFDVARDSLCPFKVVSGDVTTQVLGTSFLLNATISEVTLEVFRGRVAVFSQRSPDIKHHLERGQRITYDGGTGKFTRTEVGSGPKTILNYRNARLVTILREICFVHNLQYGLSGSDEEELRITGDFQGLSPAQIIREINLVAGTNLVLRNDSVVFAF